MSGLLEFYKKHLAGLNKYWVVTIIFFASTFLIGESNLYNRYIYDEKINALEEEIKKYEKEIETNKKKLESLKTDPEGLERFAREEYLMKKEDEDIFIIEE